MTSALFTDRYELTMLEAALRDGTALRESVFEVFTRRLPPGRRYGIVAGTGRFLAELDRFHFDDDDLEWLRREKVVDAATIDWLADFRFSGSIWGYREGEVYFPNSPLLAIESTFAEAVLLETLALSVFNYDSAVASAAARMVAAADGRPLAEMGSRRTGEHSAVAAARAAFIAGFGATSNLEAGRTWGIPTMGTAAHAFTLLHDTEEQAFRAQVDTMGAGTTLLVDTFDIRTAVETAVKVAGPGLGSVRIDSGDLPQLVAEVRAQLDALGATGTKITVTNDLDEFTIAALRAAPVDSYGVGTSVVTGSGHPAASMVFKLVTRQDAQGEWVAVGKESADKVTIGGRKFPVRARRGGIASEEIVRIDSQTVGPSERTLQVPLVTKGEIDRRWMGPSGTRLAREHREAAVGELPRSAFSLGRGEPVIATRYE